MYFHYLYIYAFFLKNLFLAALGLIAMHELSLVVVRGGYSLVALHGLLIVVALLVAEHSLLGTRDSVVLAEGSVAPQHVKSSRTRDHSGVLGIARQIANHWTIRETLH